jgi:exodeoxyribonuclease V alpha subunit
MLQRNLVYTAVTRGKRLVVLIGQRKALAIAVKGARTRRRWSKLREWLIGSARPNAAVLMQHIDGSAG